MLILSKLLIDIKIFSLEKCGYTNLYTCRSAVSSLPQGGGCISPYPHEVCPWYDDDDKSSPCSQDKHDN